MLPFADSMLNSLPGDERASLHDVRRKLSSAVMAGDQAIRAKARTVSIPEMGTTLTMAFIVGSVLYVAHVGDSRCYVFRDGRLMQLTEDHTLANKFGERIGHLSGEATQLNHVLWNCLGGGDATRPSPQIRKTELETSDAVLLCTDGLTKGLTEQEICAELKRKAPSREICERLVSTANIRGGSDNTTVALARPASADIEEARNGVGGALVQADIHTKSPLLAPSVRKDEDCFQTRLTSRQMITRGHVTETTAACEPHRGALAWSLPVASC